MWKSTRRFVLVLGMVVVFVFGRTRFHATVLLEKESECLSQQFGDLRFAVPIQAPILFPKPYRAVKNEFHVHSKHGRAFANRGKSNQVDRVRDTHVELSSVSIISAGGFVNGSEF